MVCPIMLCPRILLQETWAQNLAWDDEVDENVKFRFLKWVDNLKNLSEVKIPRVIFGDINPDDDISIHTFCDASQIAYAAVVFIRIENESGIRVNFIQAKTRVAPLKKNNSETRQSIPRLELLAATIGIRLTESILSSVDAIDVNKIKIFYWSDSSTVIAWIRRDCNWGTFVWNRVQEIRKRSNPDQWNHVPGNSNPADLPSRGCNIDQLISSNWWEGPTWLYLKNQDWPKFESICDESEITNELKKSSTDKTKRNTVLMYTLKNSETTDTSGLIKECSDFFKLKRVVAWIFRFAKNCRSTKESRITQDLTFHEIQNAENLLIKLIQQETFTGIEDERVKQFVPFRDEQGLSRIKTKIVLRKDLFNFRCPVVLPGNHEITKMIIEEKHKELNHAGVEILMNSLREKFWILGGRKIIRIIIRRCVDCQRHDSKALQTIPAPLPQNRVRDAAVFEILGVDLTGPIYLKGGQKAWICLFTCAIFRAVHLELVTSLSTASFLLALRRHIARRGRPSIIYSDNGTNFVGLNNSLKRIDFTKLAQTRAMRQIQWIFNPPAAAWWGGFWERMNGILKRLLRRTLKRSCLNYEEMLTVLLDSEAVINSRPITFLSENDHEVVPLSPSMFLQEIKEIGVVDLDQIENCQLDRKYMYRQKVKEALRSRFRNEYLGSLVIKNCKIKNTRSVTENDIVLIEVDDKKRIDWPLAKVKKVITGKDGEIRVVRLATSNGELTRPIQRIHPLELKFNDSEISNDEIVIDKYKEIIQTQKNDKIDETICEIEKTTNSVPKVVTTRSGRKIRKPDRLTYN
ncbi:uncharacterized protein LOC127279598 [Leptopilina boulardi]|uniref:uncharacterized protein LOC127279598 n=1 Tax=Leptopilina boulardi TaxID=63433 RepID=UPI0021F5B0F6|nr:uncharacterized protein LOC127279598 [Leptopilina boulardi]